MKKNIFLVLLIFSVISCNSIRKSTNDKGVIPLFEILYEDQNLGANFQFYEIISEKNEFKMLLNKDGLKGKVKENDIEKSNFILLNMGEKNTGGFSITVESVIEKENSIEVKVIQTEPSPGDMVTLAFTYPICIVKVNSKKPIVFK